MVARFSQSLTCQTVIGTKSLQKNLHFFTLSTHLLADTELKECHLVFHVQVKWDKKRVEKHFGDISGALPVFDDIIMEVKMNENMIWSSAKF